MFILKYRGGQTFRRKIYRDLCRDEFAFAMLCTLVTDFMQHIQGLSFHVTMENS